MTVCSHEQHRAGRDDCRDLRCHPLAAFLGRLYRVLRGPGAASLRRLLARVLAALEGGPMYSATLRAVMHDVHGVEVGAYSYGCFDPLRFPAAIRIGRYVSIGPGVAVYRRNHPLDRMSMHPLFYNPACAAGVENVPTRPLIIEHDAWIGAHAVILPGCVRIGRGAVVAAGAVVTRNVPDFAVVGGNPGRVLRMRFSPERIAELLSLRFWTMTASELAEQVRVDLEQRKDKSA